jgi:hypothetical protein
MGLAGSSGGVSAAVSAGTASVGAAPQLSHLMVFVSLSHQADDFAATWTPQPEQAPV